VLAEHLYATRQVAIRELIQNRHHSSDRGRMPGAPGTLSSARGVGAAALDGTVRSASGC
jgi:hypothetical protein